MSRGKHPGSRSLSRPRIVHNTNIAKDYIAESPRFPLLRSFSREQFGNPIFSIDRKQEETKLTIKSTSTGGSAAITLEDSEREKLSGILEALVADHPDKAWSKEAGGIDGRLSVSKYEGTIVEAVGQIQIRQAENTTTLSDGSIDHNPPSNETYTFTFEEFERLAKLLS